MFVKLFLYSPSDVRQENLMFGGHFFTNFVMAELRHLNFNDLTEFPYILFIFYFL